MKTVLFIPVSGPSGVGEYMRSLILAKELARAYGAIKIAFVLNKHAPYAGSCPYETFLLETSATKSTADVVKIIEAEKPAICVFDCSGRAKQYRAAQQVGSKVIFISQHKKKRARGFALNRMPWIDVHLITQLRCVDGDLNFREILKLKLFNKPAPYFIGPVMQAPALETPFDLSGEYVLFSAGGGGHTVNGVVPAEVFKAVAERWHAQTGQEAHIILGPNYRGTVASSDGVHCHASLPNDQLMALLKNARLAVLGGGDMLGQAIALGVPNISIAVAKDQGERIAALAENQLTVPVVLTVEAILEKMQQPLLTPSLPASECQGSAAFLTICAEWLES